MGRETTLKEAKKELARGAYRECLSKLDLLLKVDSLQSENGGEIGTIMITALIGQGNTQKAIYICEILSKHKKDSIRQQAKQYLSVLNSPSLERPENWSIKIPDLSMNDTDKSYSNLNNKLKKKKVTINIPPTGSTKYLSIGFTVFSCIILCLLTILLSGCVEFNTEIEVNGPDRIKMAWDTESNSSALIPWQENLNSSLKNLYPKISVETNIEEGRQLIKAPSQSSKEANKTLKSIVNVAAKSAGFDPPIVDLNLAEKNWLIGVDQKLNLNIDLSEIPEVPGLKLGIIINSFQKKESPKGYPLPANVLNKQIRWPLKTGSRNNLSFHKWQWNPIGIGTILILLIMSLSMLLQYLRLEMGLGFPELPP